MLDAILLVSTLAIFAFGYFLMKKLDAFLEVNGKGQTSAPICEKNGLRIGFSNPFLADSISDVLEVYGKQHPNVSVHLFSGAEGELCRGLEEHKLDMIFLPESAVSPQKMGHHTQRVLLCCAPAVTNCAGLSIEPITRDSIVQKAVWRSSKKSSAVASFVEYLGDFSANQP